MKPIPMLLVVALLATPGAAWARDPEAPAPAPAPTAAPPTPAPVAPANVLYEKVKIVVKGTAGSEGSILLSVEPDGRTGKLVSVNVLAGQKDEVIAEQIHREVSMAVGADYKVKLSGSEVRVSKGNKKFPSVAIVVRQLQLPGVSVRVEKG